MRFASSLKSRHSARLRAFSVIELLIAIMTIGIMVGIMILALQRTHWQAAREGVHKRNAQALAALSQAAQLGGVNPVVTGDAAATVQNLLTGVTAPALGNLKPMTYRMNLTAGESVTGALQYLRIQNGALIYESQAP